MPLLEELIEFQGFIDATVIAHDGDPGHSLAQ
jgi:hypothetical protein